MIEVTRSVIQTSFYGIWNGFAEFVPKLLAAIVIFLIGWAIANLLGKVVMHIVQSVKLDSLLRSARVEEILARGGFKLDSGAFLGGLVRGFLIVVVLVASLVVLCLNQVNVFLQGVLAYLPKVIAAVLIMLAAVLIAEFLARVVSGAAQAVAVKSSNFLGTATRWVIWIFAVLAALDQLNIATAFANILFTGVVVAFSIAAGLAFGLGGQDAAGKFIEKLKGEIAHHHRS